MVHLRFAVSHGVVKHHVLFGQLQQHRIVEELADAHILAQTLQNNKHRISGNLPATDTNQVINR